MEHRLAGEETTDGDAVETAHQLAVVRPRLDAHIGRGAFVGATSLLDGRPHAATVVAESPMDVLVVDPAGFGRLLEIPSATYELCRQLVARIRGAADE